MVVQKFQEEYALELKALPPKGGATTKECKICKEQVHPALAVLRLHVSHRHTDPYTIYAYDKSQRLISDGEKGNTDTCASCA